MHLLNYHHLLYFWVTAREGTIAAAAEQLGLSQPTISAQIKTLEEHLGHELFERVGRGLRLSGAGRTAFRYAEEIFGLGRELVDSLEGRAPGSPLRLEVGVVDALPKLLVHRVLSTAVSHREPVHVVCTEGKPTDLLARLAAHELDLVLSDSPVPPEAKIRAHGRLLGECGALVMGVRSLARKHRRGFPGSLEGAPMLLPTGNTSLRRGIDAWLEAEGVRPRIVAEFEDSGLLKVFGRAGEGLLVVPEVLEAEVRTHYALERVGGVPEVREQLFAITLDRKTHHPGAAALLATITATPFGPPTTVTVRERKPAR